MDFVLRISYFSLWVRDGLRPPDLVLFTLGQGWTSYSGSRTFHFGSGMDFVLWISYFSFFGHRISYSGFRTFSLWVRDGPRTLDFVLFSLWVRDGLGPGHVQNFPGMAPAPRFFGMGSARTCAKSEAPSADYATTCAHENFSFISNRHFSDVLKNYDDGNFSVTGAEATFSKNDRP